MSAQTLLFHNMQPWVWLFRIIITSNILRKKSKNCLMKETTRNTTEKSQNKHQSTPSHVDFFRKSMIRVLNFKRRLLSRNVLCLYWFGPLNHHLLQLLVSWYDVYAQWINHSHSFFFFLVSLFDQFLKITQILCDLWWLYFSNYLM